MLQRAIGRRVPPGRPGGLGRGGHGPLACLSVVRLGRGPPVGVWFYVLLSPCDAALGDVGVHGGPDGWVEASGPSSSSSP